MVKVYLVSGGEMVDSFKSYDSLMTNWNIALSRLIAKGYGEDVVFVINVQ